MTARGPLLLGAVGLSASIGLAAAEGLMLGPQTTARTMHVSVLDEDGRRVDGLTPADLTVKDDGRECVVVSVAPPSTRMQLTIAVEVAIARYGDVRKAIFDLAVRLLPEADVSLLLIRDRPEEVTPPTDDINAIVAGLNSFLEERPRRRGTGSSCSRDGTWSPSR